MQNPEELAYASLLSQINTQLPIYFSYFMPWIALATNLFTISILYLRKRTENNLLIFIFKWQYMLGLIYTLNLLLNDNQFSQALFNFSFRIDIPDWLCKITYSLRKFFYCVSPWMQVVITFDRLWSVYLANKFRFKRNRLTITILTLTVMALVLGVNLIHLAYYARSFRQLGSVFNATLNRSVLTTIHRTQCFQGNTDVLLAQDIVFVIMRIILPLIIMIVCNVILIRHIRQAKKKVINGRNQKREHHFTIAVSLTNGAFLVFNIGVAVYYVIFYVFRFSSYSLSFLGTFQFEIYFTVSTLFSYMFTLCQFWIDLGLNRLFRKEIWAGIWFLSGRGNQVADETQIRSTGNTK